MNDGSSKLGEPATSATDTASAARGRRPGHLPGRVGQAAGLGRRRTPEKATPSQPPAGAYPWSR